MSHALDNNIQQRSKQQLTNTRRQIGPTDIQPTAKDNSQRENNSQTVKQKHVQSSGRTKKM